MSDPTTHVLRVALAHKHSVFRDLEIPSSKSLHALAEGIVTAFDFDFDHAFGFYSGLTPRTIMEANPKYELFVDMGEATGETSPELMVVETVSHSSPGCAD